MTQRTERAEAPSYHIVCCVANNTSFRNKVIVQRKNVRKQAIHIRGISSQEPRRRLPIIRSQIFIAVCLWNHVSWKEYALALHRICAVMSIQNPIPCVIHQQYSSEPRCSSHSRKDFQSLQSSGICIALTCCTYAGICGDVRPAAWYYCQGIVLGHAEYLRFYIGAPVTLLSTSVCQLGQHTASSLQTTSQRYGRLRFGCRHCGYLSAYRRAAAALLLSASPYLPGRLMNTSHCAPFFNK